MPDPATEGCLLKFCKVNKLTRDQVMRRVQKAYFSNDEIQTEAVLAYLDANAPEILQAVPVEE